MHLTGFVSADLYYYCCSYLFLNNRFLDESHSGSPPLSHSNDRNLHLHLCCHGKLNILKNRQDYEFQAKSSNREQRELRLKPYMQHSWYYRKNNGNLNSKEKKIEFHGISALLDKILWVSKYISVCLCVLFCFCWKTSWSLGIKE